MWEHLVRVSIAVAGLFLWCWPTTAFAPPKQDVVFRVLGTTEQGVYLQPMMPPQFIFGGPSHDKGVVLRCNTETFQKTLTQKDVTFSYPAIALVCEGQRYELKGIAFTGKD